MILELIVVALVGIIIGMNIRQEILSERYNKTLQQVDAEVRSDLAYYKNLSESLKNDIAWLKQKQANTQQSRD